MLNTNTIFYIFFYEKSKKMRDYKQSFGPEYGKHDR